MLCLRAIFRDISKDCGTFFFCLYQAKERLVPCRILGPKNEKNTIIETPEARQPTTDHNIPEDLKRGSDLCSRPSKSRARTPALIPHCSVNKIISYLNGFAMFRICETSLTLSIY
jgi:hypothetical protein